MNAFEKKSRIVITCLVRLSPFLEREVIDLGFKPQRTFATGVELYETFTACMALCMKLRTASQVLYAIKEFEANDPQQLYTTVARIPWEDYLRPDGYVSVTSNVDHPTVNNTMFVNVKVKDAIADHFRNKTGKRPDSGPDLDRAVVHLYWKKSQATVFLDAAGETLAKHGYRKYPGKAPMLEALVSATLMASQWDRQSVFVNPMCGSGTIAIEAALMATGRYPGLCRNNYGFMHVVGYRTEQYEAIQSKLREQVKPACPRIIVNDMSADAINITRMNAKLAGVEDYIEYHQGDFETVPVPEGAQGVVYFNPEYGERLGEITALEKTYARIGDFLKKKCQGYKGYIFTGNLDLAKLIGLKAARRIEFYSSKIDCRLLEYELYAGSREKPKKE